MKIIENGIILYNSLNENLNISDLNIKAYDKEIFDSLLNLIPENFRTYNDYFKTLSELSSFVVSKEINNIEDINNIYNPDLGSEAIIDFLANRYDILFPINYDISQKRLILKYYPNFIKIKGTEFAIKILDFVGRNEVDFYNLDFARSGHYTVNYYYEGFSEIIIEDEEDRDRIRKYLKFAQTLVNRVTPAGMYSRIVIL